MVTASDLGHLGNEVRKNKRPTVRLQVVPAADPEPVLLRRNYLQRLTRLAPSGVNVWRPADEEDVTDAAYMPVLTRIMIPTIDAFLAFALLKAFFYPDGWVPNADIAETTESGILRYALPVLLGYRCGKVLYGFRGAMLGVIVASAFGIDVPAIIPAIAYTFVAVVVLRFADWCFEMALIRSNIGRGFALPGGSLSKIIFSGAALGAAVLARRTGKPLVDSLVSGFADATELFADAWKPLGAIIVEPAKVLFFDDGITKDVMLPMEATNVTKSLHYLMQSNPGPGAGTLLAITAAGPRYTRTVAPLALVILLFGGIPEVYYIYVYMLPQLLLALIVASFSGLIVVDIARSGLTKLPQPPSIMVIADATPSGDGAAVTISILIGATVSFVVSYMLLISIRNKCKACAAWIAR